METGRLRQQVASVQKGVAFLKREHLAMLTGLQVEITDLKRRCHELTCELDSKFPQKITAEEAELAVRHRAAEGLLEEQRCMMVGVREELRARQVRAWALGRDLREDERRFLEELRRRGHEITALSREVYRQTVTTATLCQELHNARFQLYQQSQAAGEGAGVTQEAPGREGGPEEAEREEGERERDEEDEDGEDWLLSPTPPTSPGRSDAPPPRRRVGVRARRVRACVPCERVTSPQKPRPMPDPALFLVPLRHRLVRWKRPTRSRDGEGPPDEWEDVTEDGRVRRRVDMGTTEGETAL